MRLFSVILENKDYFCVVFDVLSCGCEQGGGGGRYLCCSYCSTSLSACTAPGQILSGLFGVKIQFYMFDMLCASEGDFATPAFTPLPLAWLEEISVSVLSNM